MSRNIVLVGFMGAGKSTVAGKLARILKRELIATDALIEQKEGRVIARIFQDSGEPYFREVEKGVIAEVSGKENLVIDGGGGVVLSDENITHFKKNGVIFYLSVTPEVIYQRIKNQKHRPLLNVENPKAEIERLLKIREPRYQKADHTVDTCPRTPEQVADEIVRLMHDE